MHYTDLPNSLIACCSSGSDDERRLDTLIFMYSLSDLDLVSFLATLIDGSSAYETMPNFPLKRDKVQSLAKNKLHLMNPPVVVCNSFVLVQDR